MKLSVHEERFPQLLTLGVGEMFEIPQKDQIKLEMAIVHSRKINKEKKFSVRALMDRVVCWRVR